MEFTNGIKACLSLAEQADIREKDITVLDLGLGTFLSTAMRLLRLTRSLFPRAAPTSVRPLGVIRRSFDSSTLILFMLDTSGFDGSIVSKTGISM